MRDAHPVWGARKIARCLEREGMSPPAVSTVHQILCRSGRIETPPGGAVASQRFEMPAPNLLWQMDFKSPKGWNAPAGPLSVLDDRSRYLLALQAVWTTHGDLVREQLETAFSSCGVPQAMLMDHGIPWWSARARRARRN